MTAPDYRKRYAKASSKREKRSDAPGPRADVPELLAVLADKEADRERRLAALRELQALSFAAEQFQEHGRAYVAVLRAAATDRDARVRRAVLEVLAQRKDEYAQRTLIEGLEGKVKPLVPTRTALKLLAYDQHAAPRGLLRRLGSESSDPIVRRHALRQLTSDGSSKDVFHRIAGDPEEDPRLRRLGLVALQSLDPDGFRKLARRLAVDDDATDDLRAASLTALANDVGAERGEASENLEKAVEQVRDQTGSRALTRAADGYLNAVRRR